MLLVVGVVFALSIGLLYLLAIGMISLSETSSRKPPLIHQAPSLEEQRATRQKEEFWVFVVIIGIALLLLGTCAALNAKFECQGTDRFSKKCIDLARQKLNG